MLINAIPTGADSGCQGKSCSQAPEGALLLHHIVFFRHSWGHFVNFFYPTEKLLYFVLYFPDEKTLLGHLEARLLYLTHKGQFIKVYPPTGVQTTTNEPSKRTL